MKASEPTVDDFLKVVGTILTEWGQVEFAHAILFQIAACGVFANTALLGAYWSVTSFEGRQKMVDAALRDAFHDHEEYLATWNNLNNRLIAKNRVRNKIAHGSVIPFNRPDGVVEISLIPFFYSRMREHIDGNTLKKGMVISDLNAIAESFRAMSADLYNFQNRYFEEQILPRATTRPDGSKEVPLFHRPKSPTPKE